MVNLGIILLVFSFVCAVLAALVWPNPPGNAPGWFRVHLGWLALAFLVAAMIFGGLKL